MKFCNNYIKCIFIICEACDLLFVGKDLVDRFGENLRESYKDTRFIYEGAEWPLFQPKAVVNVVVMSYKGKRTHRETIEIVKRHKVGTPGVDNLVSPTTAFNPPMITKKIDDIFSADPTCRTSEIPSRILIEGAPGIGKTVLVKEAAYKWAIGELLDDKRLLIALFLRDHYIQSVRSLQDLLKELVQYDDEMFTQVNRFIIQNNGKGVAFLIDGFDEYPAEFQNKSFIYQLICGRILQRATVVVTSRPNATSKLLNIVHKRVEILGFAEEQRNDYIKASLNKKAKRKTLEEYLNLNPIINSLCYVPLHLAILLYLFQENSLPETLTEMNQLFVLHTVYHHLKGDLPDSISKLENLPESIHSIIVKLSKMAYIGLKHNKLVFTYGEVEKLCPEIIGVKEAANGYGLLQAIQHRPYKRGAVGVSTSFNFLHFTMQEFLAAYFVSTLPAKQQLQMLNEFWEDSLSFMWMMYVGLTGINSSPFSKFVVNQQEQVSYSSTENRKRGLHLFQCFLETSSPETRLPEMVPSLFTNERIDLQGLTLLPYHVLSITSFIAKSPLEWKHLNLENCHMGDTGMLIIKRFLCNSHYKEKISSIESINLFGNDLTSLHDAYHSIIKNGHFMKFNMSKQKLNDKFIAKISDALTGNATIKSIDLSHNGFGIDSAKELAACLEVNSTLEELDISYNGVITDGAEMISRALCSNTVLKHLNIAHNNICDEGAVALSKCLAYNSTLKELNVSWNSISSKGADRITSSLCLMQDGKLSVENSDCSENFEIESKVNTTLQVLDLSHNRIGNHGVQSLSLMLQNNSSLITLNISHNGLSDDELAIVADSIKGNTSLQNLNLSGNNISSAAKFAKLLQCNQHLSTLNLQQFHHGNPLAFNMTILNSIAHSNQSIKWLGLPKPAEEWQLDRVIAAINQSRSSLSIKHVIVEYYK